MKRRTSAITTKTTEMTTQPLSNPNIDVFSNDEDDDDEDDDEEVECKKI